MAGADREKCRRSRHAAVAAFGLAFLALSDGIPALVRSDTLLQLYSGRDIVRDGLPHVDTYTIEAAGRASIEQQWLAHVLAWAAEQVGGFAGVAGLSTALIAFWVAVLAAFGVHRGVPLMRVVPVTLLALLASLMGMFPRAQSFAYPLAAGLLWLLASEERRLRGAGTPGWRTVAALVALALWANLHGSALLFAGLTAGLAMLGAVHLWRVQRSSGRSLLLLAAALLAAVTPLATPYATAIVGYYRSITGNEVIRDYQGEWQTPALDTPGAYAGLALAVLAVGLVIISLRRRKGLPVALTLTTAMTAAMALDAQRNVVWFATAAALLSLELLGRIAPPGERAPSRAWSVAVPLGVAATMVAVVLLAVRSEAYFLSATPVEAAHAVGQYAEQRPDARILADDAGAAALLYFEPHTKGRVAFDGRLSVFGQGSLRAWYEWQYSLDEHRALAARYDVFLVTREHHDDLAQRLRARSDLVVLHESARAIAVVRGDVQPAEQLSQ